MIQIIITAYPFVGKSFKIKSVVQRRLEFLKAVRFGRNVLNELVCWASYEGSHSSGRMLISSEILENQICDQRRLEFLKAVRFGSNPIPNTFEKQVSVNTASE